MLHPSRVVPHFLQAVKSADLRLEYVHYNIYVVDKHPVQCRLPFCPVGVLPGGFFHLRIHKIHDCLYLGIGACLTNNKEIGYSLRYLTQVEGYDVFPFFFLYGAYYGFKKFTVSV